jgi:hypothetical protein
MTHSRWPSLLGGQVCSVAKSAEATANMQSTGATLDQFGNRRNWPGERPSALHPLAGPCSSRRNSDGMLILMDESDQLARRSAVSAIRPGPLGLIVLNNMARRFEPRVARHFEPRVVRHFEPRVARHFEPGRREHPP